MYMIQFYEYMVYVLAYINCFSHTTANHFTASFRWFYQFYWPSKIFSKFWNVIHLCLVFKLKSVILDLLGFLIILLKRLAFFFITGTCFYLIAHFAIYRCMPHNNESVVRCRRRTIFRFLICTSWFIEKCLLFFVSGSQRQTQKPLPSETDNVHRMSLPVSGLASYKFKGSLWTPSGGHERQLASTLFQRADNLLRQLQVSHPDFQFFSRWWYQIHCNIIILWIFKNWWLVFG